MGSLDELAQKDYEQQEFIRGLAQEVRNAADESGNYDDFVLNFGAVILGHLCARARGGLVCVQAGTAGNLMKNFITRINERARFEAEKDYLFWLLFEELKPSIFARIYREYSKEVIRFL
jgi:hypothetical protein